MAFRNLRAILGPLDLPIGDKTYSIPPLAADWGVRFRLVAEGGIDEGVEELTHERELELFLGPALGEMRADGVHGDYIELAWLTALAEFNRGRPAAERTWEAGPNPNLIAALQAAAQERKKSSPDSTPSPSSAKAKGTRPRAGTSSTTSPPATPPTARKSPAKASAGRK